MCKFVEVLLDMVYWYNRFHQSTIGRTPIDENAEIFAEVFKRIMYCSQPLLPIKPKLEVEQKVHISKTRCTFDESYLPNWAEEIFTVDQTMATNSLTYKIVDYGNEPVEDSFYDRELQRIAKIDEVFKIEKILRSRKR